MKQLDEMEELAKDVCAYQQRFGITAELVNGALKDQRIDALARALLAVMPVVRAAVEWADDGSPISECSPTEAALGYAILKMRMTLKDEP